MLPLNTAWLHLWLSSLLTYHLLKSPSLDQTTYLCPCPFIHHHPSLFSCGICFITLLYNHPISVLGLLPLWPFQNVFCEDQDLHCFVHSGVPGT